MEHRRTSRLYETPGLNELLWSGDFVRGACIYRLTISETGEALVHRHLPVEALLGVCCYSQKAKREIDAAMSEHGVDLRTIVRPGWYFR